VFNADAFALTRSQEISFVILQELCSLHAADNDGGDDCLHLLFNHLLNQQPKSYYKMNDNNDNGNIND
jgi:hypothetical protein